MDEEYYIYQRVRARGYTMVDRDIEAFCSRCGDGTVVISVSLSEVRNGRGTGASIGRDDEKD